MFLYSFYEVTTCIGVGMYCGMKVIVNNNMCILCVMQVQFLPWTLQNN